MIARSVNLIRTFIATGAMGGVILIAAAALAIALANSPLSDAYFSLLHVHIAGLSLLHWINDGLMTLFFLLVGLEIKREILEGELRSWKQRALPGAAALGGMIVPAIIYFLINQHDPVALKGWAISSATDIAFALGVLVLLGPRVPASLRIFLTAVAVLDDLGAIIIIALFYTSQIAWLPLMAALGGLAILTILNRCGVRSLIPYLVIGLGIWLGVLLSGVHATLAGVAVAFAIPLRTSRPPEDGKPDTPPLHILEHGIHPWVAFLIMPIFGLANAGVSFIGMEWSTVIHHIPMGIAISLFVGKQIGILSACWMMVRAGLAHLPYRASWRHMHGVATLCGIGFTMSLFIGILAFGQGSANDEEVKVGIILGSTLSALVGAILLYGAPAKQDDAPSA